MTREEFVKAYAERSHLSAQWATLGIIDIGGKVRCAMPCECGQDGCEGWVMLSAEHISDHLFFRAPEPLRAAYRKAVGSP